MRARLYHDAITNEIDHAVVVTNDTDIAPALSMVRKHTNVIVGLVVPTRDQERIPNFDLVTHAHWVRSHITDIELRASQLPRVIPGRKPTIKPESWYARPDLLAKVVDEAMRVLGDRGETYRWLSKENAHLGGAVPMDLVETEEGAQQVLSYIADYAKDQAPPR